MLTKQPLAGMTNMWMVGCLVGCVSGCETAEPTPDAGTEDAGGVPQIDAGAAPESDAGVDAGVVQTMCGDVRGSDLIYYGTARPGHVTLSEGEVMAVGLVNFGTPQHCSGTLIAPRWALTAQHCPVRLGNHFCMGMNPRDPGVCIEIVSSEAVPSTLDTQLIGLAEDATMALPGVMPIPFQVEPFEETRVGEAAEIAGYGLQERGGYREREFAVTQIGEVRTEAIVTDGRGMAGPCGGDSGGPLLVVDPATSRTLVAGTLLGGEASCVGRDNYSRFDASAEWLMDRTGASPVEGCGGISSEGRCVDGRSLYCEDGRLVTDPCTGRFCGWVEPDGFRCRDTRGECGEVTTAGRCDGRVAQWCDHGELRQRDCAGCDQLCGEVRGVGAYCLGAPGACQGVSFGGRCNGTVLEWCNPSDGAFQQIDCADYSRTCAFVNEEVGFDCVMP